MRQGENQTRPSAPSILYMAIALNAEPATKLSGSYRRESEAPVPVVGVRGEDCGDSSPHFGARKVATPDTSHMTFDLSASRTIEAAD